MLGSPIDVANAALLLRDTIKGAILIVEGSSDLRLLERLLSPKAGFVMAGGKPRVLGALERIRSLGGTGFLGVVDRDFGSLEGVALPDDVFTWDHHDLEITLVASDAFEILVRHFCVENKLIGFLGNPTCDRLRAALLNVAGPLGALRGLSARDSMGLPFDRINLPRYIDRRTLTVNFPRLVRAVLQERYRSQQGANDLIQACLNMIDGCHDLRDVVRGHDLLTIMAVGLEGAFASFGDAAPTCVVLEATLMSIFAMEHFRSTSLYTQLNDWAARNPRYPMMP